jgi:hypothetical protein
MSINESSATALVRFTGLGIICFNKDRQRGEIGALRDNQHVLTIKIQKPVFQEGSDKDIVVYQDIVTYENLPNEDVRIDIKASGSTAIEGYEIYQSGDFNRLDSPDVNDFRWLVNMHTLHAGGDLTPSPKQTYPLAKIFIGNGLFYTHKLDRNLFFEKVEKDASGAATKREAFGNVAETVGVKIEGDEVTFTIRIGDKEERQALKRVEGLPYRIEIKNMDYSAHAVLSDMPDYYRYLSSTAGKQFDLTPVVEEGEGGGAINQKEFCHPIIVDDPPSIEFL